MGTDVLSSGVTILPGDTDSTDDTGKSTTYRTSIRSHARRSRYQHRLYRAPVGSKVVNLSNCNLSTAELSVLDKGLTFIPQTYTMGNKQLLNDFDDFARRLRIQYLYYDSPNTIYDPFKPKSTRPYLNSGNKTLETYINNTRSQLHQLHSIRPTRDNLSPSERRAFASLQKKNRHYHKEG